MHLDGLGIMVKDMAVMVRFYRDVLGFRDHGGRGRGERVSDEGRHGGEASHA